MAGVKVGIVVAMDNEALALECLSGRGEFRVVRAGVGSERAAAAARRLVEEGCTALISAGICGGLIPELDPGILVLAEAVRAPDGATWVTDLKARIALAERFRERVPYATGTLTGSERVIRRPAQKAETAARTGAVAVDMESHAVAQAAAEAGVPFLVLRVVSDPHDAELPKSALVGVTPEGHRRPLRVVSQLLKRPGDIPALIRLAEDTKRAERTLSSVAALGARIGFGLG